MRSPANDPPNFPFWHTTGLLVQIASLIIVTKTGPGYIGSLTEIPDTAKMHEDLHRLGQHYGDVFSMHFRGRLVSDSVVSSFFAHLKKKMLHPLQV